MTLAELPDEISPFPSAAAAGTLLHGYHDSATPPPSSQSQLQLSSLQKLRPIRSNGTLNEFTDSPPASAAAENGGSIGDLVYGLQEMVAVKSSSHQMLPPPPPPQKLRVVRSGGGDKDSKELSSATVDLGGGGGEVSDREGGVGNRWPEEETLSLLRIRSEMDVQFRVSNPKGPLWEIVSRKLEELGYHRDPNKCREKFENVYKYYKRTKERISRVGVPQGRKVYKFFSELKALDHHHEDGFDVPIGEVSVLEENCNTTILTPDPVENPLQIVGIQNNSTDLSRQFGSDDENEECEELNEENVEAENRKRKRGVNSDNVEGYFEELMKKVMKKQDDMFKQVVEIMEKREKERIAREEAWKQQEMERRRREEEVRAHENSRSLALISFIEKFLGQQIHVPQSPQSSFLDDRKEKHEEKSVCKFDKNSNRWPKAEVQALITLRISRENKFQGSASRGSLWDEVSIDMSSMGYSRSAKKCKEKWENINKYFKRSMESGKKRAENAKTCPYFRQLEALYKNRVTNLESPPTKVKVERTDRSSNEEILTTLAQVCNLFSLSEALEPMEALSSPPPHDKSTDIQASQI